MLTLGVNSEFRQVEYLPFSPSQSGAFFDMFSEEETKLTRTQSMSHLVYPMLTKKYIMVFDL